MAAVRASGLVSTFVGQLLMKDAGGHNVVNPLFIVYGCFEP